MIETMSATSAASMARSYLEPLAGALGSRGFLARVTHLGNGPSFVQAANRHAPQLSERVFAAQADGAWWFWWSWAERIALVEDIEFTADKIAHVLTPQAA